MNYAVGCDIEEVKRFENKTQTFLDKVFTKAEQEYCQSEAKPYQHFAARFCAKEAVVKALCSLGFAAPAYKDIEIKRLENGVPYVVLHAPEIENVRFAVSLSHSRANALATVAAWLE